MRARFVRTGLPLALALAAAPAAAQIPLTPRALGMGGASYVAAARGQEALFLNPANLGLPGQPHWSFALPQLAAGETTVGIGFGDLLDFIEYGDLEDDRKAEILAEIPDQGTELAADIRVPLAAIQMRRVAVGVSYAVTGSHTVEKDLIDLLFNGVDTGRLVGGGYDLTGIRENTEGFRATFLDFAAAYGNRVGPVALGVTGHYYRGTDLVRSGVTRVDAQIADQDVEVRYSGVRREGGNGFGLDLGAAFQATPALTLSASIGNLVNTFEWDDQLRFREVVLNREDYESGDLNDINADYVQNETDYDPSTASAEVQALASDIDVDTKLPRTLRAGAAFKPGTGTTVAVGLQTNLDESRLSGLYDESISLGVQQQIAILGLRAGIARVGDGTMLSAGLSVGPIHFGLARVNTGDYAGGDREGWVATFGLGTSSQSTMP